MARMAQDAQADEAAADVYFTQHIEILYRKTIQVNKPYAWPQAMSFLSSMETNLVSFAAPPGRSLFRVR